MKLRRGLSTAIGFSLSRPGRVATWKGLSITDRLHESFGAMKMLRDLAPLKFSSDELKEKSQTASVPTKLEIKRKDKGGLPADKDVILEFISFLSSHNIRAVLAGSIAGFCYSEPRATKDVDLNLDIRDGEKFLEAMKQLPDATFSQPTKLHVSGRRDSGAVPVVANVTFKGVGFDLFFNTWWGTEHAMQNAKKTDMKFKTGSKTKALEVIPPESFCLFKSATLKPKSKRFHRDKQDLQNVLEFMEESEVRNVDEYVKAGLDKLWGKENETPLREWNDCVSSRMKDE